MTSALQPAGTRPVLSVIQGGLSVTVIRRRSDDVFGDLLWLGATDGQHRLGSARAVRTLGAGAGDDPGGGRQLDALLRLSEHYGDWLGFRGPARSTGVAKIRFLRDLPHRADRIEYRIHIRRIGRRHETLVADGEALCEGVPILRAEGIHVGR